jgi:hypothetical protein
MFALPDDLGRSKTLRVGLSLGFQSVSDFARGIDHKQVKD